MAETPKLLDMGYDAPGSCCKAKACESDKMGARKICVSDQTNGLNCYCKACESNKRGTQKISVSHQPNGLNFTNFKPDPFVVDMERLSRLPDHDATANSRVTRSLSRKLSQPPGSEKDGGVIPSSSPTEIAAAVGGAKSPGNATRATLGTADLAVNAQVHHHITITTGSAGSIAAENRSGTCRSAKKSSFRRSLPFWAIHFSRIPLYLAALSIAGTLVLIYFTLSAAKHGGDDSALNW